MQDKLNELKKEFFTLKTVFSRRIDGIEQKIHSLEKQLTEFPSQEESLSLDLDDLVKTTEPLTIPESSLPNKALHIKDNRNPMQGSLEPALETKEAPLERKNQKTILSSLAENILPMFGPVSSILIKFLEVYKHYQSQGKTPVFFMTLAGILTLVMGFGYLLQYSFSQFLGPSGKVIIGFAGSLGITLCGVLICRKRSDMADYASSLIGLGMILSYLSAYFSGPFYNIISDFWSFVLLGFITGAAYVLAVTFKTKIVAIVSLLGGTFAPLFMARADQSYQIYLTYVLIIVIAMLHLSKRINWQVLAHTSMIVSFLAIEYILLALPSQHIIPWGLIILIHLFFYVFAVYNNLSIIKQTSITKTTVLSFSSNLFFYLFALNQVVHENAVLGKLYLLNALILSVAFCSIPALTKSFKAITSQCKKTMQMTCLLSIGLLAGFGILALTRPDFLGLIWGIEALLLLYMGTRFNIAQVRVEAHIILILSFVFSAFNAVLWVTTSIVPVPEILQLKFGYGWMNLMITWMLLWPYVTLLEQTKNQQIHFEEKLFTGLNEILSICLSLSFLMTIGLFWNQGIWLLSIVPMFYLMYRSKVKTLKHTEYAGWFHFLLLFVPMMTSAQLVDSFFFSEQIVLGKIARIEAFFCLIFIAEFYRRYHKDSTLNSFAQLLRPAFFCIIPFSFLPGIWHQYLYFFPFAIWGSTVICLALFCWLKYPVLKTEVQFLALGAGIVSIIACVLTKFAGWQGHSMLSLTSGLVFFSLVLLVWKGLKKELSGTDEFLFMRKELSLFYSSFFYYLGIFLFIIIYASAGSAPLAFILTIGYFCFLLIKLQLFEPLKNDYTLLYTIVSIFAIIMVIIHLMTSGVDFSTGPGISAFLFHHGIFSIIALFFYGVLAHKSASHFEEARNRLGGQIFQLWGFHCLACLTYIGALSQWFNKGFGPALSVAFVMHATIVLFLTLRPKFQKLISLAVTLFAIAAVKIIFWDMNDFFLIQKVIAFIMIGSLLLVAAYQYQKMKTAVLESEKA
jgi:predicted membrane protein DUF2339